MLHCSNNPVSFCYGRLDMGIITIIEDIQRKLLVLFGNDVCVSSKGDKIQSEWLLSGYKTKIC